MAEEKLQAASESAVNFHAVEERRINAIVLFVEFPFSQRDYDRFGIEILEGCGFQVGVWDFSRLFFPGVWKQLRGSDYSDWSHCRLFSGRSEALAAISQLSRGTLVVSLLSYGLNSLAVYRAVSKRGLNYAVFAANTLPTVTYHSDFKALVRKLRNLTATRVLDLILACTPHVYLGIRQPRLVLAGGEKSWKGPLSSDPSAEILWCHALDYDLHLQAVDRPGQLNENVGVFLDECVPFHPDDVLRRIPPPAAPEAYFPSLLRFFDYLEQAYGLRIVVAAHPRSRYDGAPKYFGSRTVIKGKTFEMVRNAGFVVLHSSTSVNFAVLFKKPCLFLTSHTLNKSYMGPQIRLMASLLGKKPINLDEDSALDWERELQIDEAAYHDYRTCYIKKDGSPELPFWRIVADRVGCLR
jgi:hypothetical protein